MTPTQALQHLLGTLKIIQKSPMSQIDKGDCIHNLKQVAEWIGEQNKPEVNEG